MFIAVHHLPCNHRHGHRQIQMIPIWIARSKVSAREATKIFENNTISIRKFVLDLRLAFHICDTWTIEMYQRSIWNRQLTMNLLCLQNNAINHDWPKCRTTKCCSDRIRCASKCPFYLLCPNFVASAPEKREKELSKLDSNGKVWWSQLNTLFDTGYCYEHVCCFWVVENIYMITIGSTRTHRIRWLIFLWTILSLIIRNWPNKRYVLHEMLTECDGVASVIIYVILIFSIINRSETKVITNNGHLSPNLYI